MKFLFGFHFFRTDIFFTKINSFCPIPLRCIGFYFTIFKSKCSVNHIYAPFSHVTYMNEPEVFVPHRFFVSLNYIVSDLNGKSIDHCSKYFSYFLYY